MTTATRERKAKDQALNHSEIIWCKEVRLADDTVLNAARFLGHGANEGREYIQAEMAKLTVGRAAKPSPAELQSAMSEAIGFPVRFTGFADLGKGADVVRANFERAEEPAKARGQKRPAAAVAGSNGGAPKVSSATELRDVAGQVERNGGTAEDHPGEPERGKHSSKVKAKLVEDKLAAAAVASSGGDVGATLYHLAIGDGDADAIEAAKKLEGHGIHTFAELAEYANRKMGHTGQNGIYAAIRSQPGVTAPESRALQRVISQPPKAAASGQPSAPPAESAARTGPADSARSSEPATLHPDGAVSIAIALDRIKVSPFNPRKHFDPVKLQEMADSIKDHGVLQPIVVRPIYAGRGPRPIAHYENPPSALYYEIVCGERRWRASKLAGKPEIPCVVRELSDLVADKIRLTENVQRADLDPLEEAAGYRRMMDVHGYTVDRLAVEMGKSKGYIYGILKLLDLPEKAQQSMAKGELLKSTAQLIARIPFAKGREQATKFALERAWGDRRPGYREVKDHIEERFMIELKQAPFTTKDASLTSAGACTDCPKRTGNNRDEFPDARADICTDPTCYQEKVQAWQERQTATSEAEGHKVLRADHAEKLFGGGYGGAEHTVRYDAPYVDLAEQCHEHPRRKSFKQLVGEQLKDEVVIAFDPAGKLHRLVPKVEAAQVLKKEHNVQIYPGSNGTSRHQLSAEEKRRREADRLQGRVNRRCLEEIVAKAEAAYAGVPTHLAKLIRAIVLPLADELWSVTQGEIIRRRNPDASIAHFDAKEKAMRKLVEDLEPAPLFGLLVELGTAKQFGSHGSSTRQKEMLAAFGIDRKAIERELKAEKAKPRTTSKAKGPELMADLGIEEEALSRANIVSRFANGNVKKAISVQPFKLDDRLWIATGGVYHGGYHEETIRPLYTVPDYRAQFAKQPSKLQPSVSLNATDAERREFYTGVLVSVRGESYAIGPGSEERTVHNGKARPKR